MADQALAVTQAAQQPAGSSAQTVASTTSQLASAQFAATAVPQVTATSQPGPFTWLTSAIQNFLQSGLPTPTNNYLGLNPTFYT